MSNHLITFMVSLPFFGALFQAFLPEAKGFKSEPVSKWLALVFSSLASLSAFVLVSTMQRQVAELQMTEVLPWVGAYAISYEMGVDGLNALLVLLVAIVFPVLIGVEWNQKAGARGIFGLFLSLQGAFFGLACAQDIFLQFFFWSFTALPIYFLIGIWGGANREVAAFRSIVSSSIGNALVLAALVLVYYSVDPHTFSLRELSGMRFSGKTFEVLGREFSVPFVAFALIGIGLAFRAAIWPLHGWFTMVAKEAPPAVFVISAAVTIPAAVYLFMRLTYTLFPETSAHMAGVVVAVGTINLVIGGISSISQKDLRSLLAFLCISGLGFVLLGVGSLDAAGVVGAVYAQLGLGLGLAGFGIFSGLIHDRVGNTVFAGEAGEADPLGGFAAKAPGIALFAGIFVASLLGFPGLGGFVGQTLLIIGAFPLYPGAAILAMISVLFATYYLFMMYRKIFLGKPDKTAGVLDLGLRERTYLVPLVVALVLSGIYPKPLLELVRPTVLTLLSTMK